jgi:hypothetical protein
MRGRGLPSTPNQAPRLVRPVVLDAPYGSNDTGEVLMTVRQRSADDERSELHAARRPRVSADNAARAWPRRALPWRQSTHLIVTLGLAASCCSCRSKGESKDRLAAGSATVAPAPSPGPTASAGREAANFSEITAPAHCLRASLPLAPGSSSAWDVVGVLSVEPAAPSRDWQAVGAPEGKYGWVALESTTPVPLDDKLARYMGLLEIAGRHSSIDIAVHDRCGVVNGRISKIAQAALERSVLTAIVPVLERANADADSRGTFAVLGMQVTPTPSHRRGRTRLLRNVDAKMAREQAVAMLLDELGAAGRTQGMQVLWPWVEAHRVASEPQFARLTGPHAWPGAKNP